MELITGYIQKRLIAADTVIDTINDLIQKYKSAFENKEYITRYDIHRKMEDEIKEFLDRNFEQYLPEYHYFNVDVSFWQNTYELEIKWSVSGPHGKTADLRKILKEKIVEGDVDGDGADSRGSVRIQSMPAQVQDPKSGWLRWARWDQDSL